MAEGVKTIPFAGGRFELVQGDDVRAADLAACRLTLRRVPGGEVTVLHAADLTAGPSRRNDDDREPLDLRVLVEELLDRGFSDAWVEAIATFTFRHGLLRTP